MVIRVLLADDHRVLRQALQAMFERHRDIEVVGQASTGAEAVRLAEERKPDVVVMDISMPSLDGIAATRRLVANLPGVKVLALSAHLERHYVQEMLRAGAMGYLDKSASLEEMLRALRALSENRTYLCNEAAGIALGAMRRPEGAGQALRRREEQVLALVAEGLNSQEIGDRLHIAKGTVMVHRQNIMRKLGLHSVAELTKYAIQRGLTSN